MSEDAELVERIEALEKAVKDLSDGLQFLVSKIASAHAASDAALKAAENTQPKRIHIVGNGN